MNVNSKFVFLSVDNQYIPAIEVYTADKETIYFQNYIQNYDSVYSGSFPIKCCFKENDDFRIREIVYFDEIPIKKFKFAPLDYNHSEKIDLENNIGVLYDFEKEEYKTLYIKNNVFYYNGERIDILKLPEKYVKEFRLLRKILPNTSDGGYNKLYLCENAVISIDVNLRNGNRYKCYDLVCEDTVITNNLDFREIDNLSAILTYVECSESRENNLSIEDYSNLPQVYESTCRINDNIYRSTCADYVKTLLNDYTFYLDLTLCNNNGNNLDTVVNWINFISDLSHVKLEIRNTVTNNDINSNSRLLRKYLEVYVNGKINTPYEKYVYLMLIRYLQGGRTGFIPKLSMDIYSDLHDKFGISKFQAILIAHHVPSYHGSYSLGTYPGLCLSFQNFLSNVDSGKRVNVYFTNPNIFSTIPMLMKLFKQKNYTTIYNTLNAHYYGNK